MVLICKYKNITKTYYNFLVYLYTQKKDRLSAVKGSVQICGQAVMELEPNDHMTVTIHDAEHRMRIAAGTSASNLNGRVSVAIISDKPCIRATIQNRVHVNLEHNKYLQKVIYFVPLGTSIV